jgi:hypothetical protein
MSPARKRARKPVKVTDEATVIRCASGDGLLREEVWKDAKGNVVRYNLAFINLQLFPWDHGRVLGYDTAHGPLHRHFAGKVEIVAAAPYELIQQRFLAEVEELKKRRSL